MPADKEQNRESVGTALAEMIRNHDMQPAKIMNTIAVCKSLQKLYLSQIEKVQELQKLLTIHLAVSQQEGQKYSLSDIKGSGYRVPSRSEYNKWSFWAQACLPYSRPIGTDSLTAVAYRGPHVVTLIKLVSGDELVLKEPCFLSGFDYRKARYKWLQSNALDGVIPKDLEKEWLEVEGLDRDSLDKRREYANYRTRW